MDEPAHSIIRTIQQKHVHVHKLGQVWTQRLRAFLANVVP